MANQEQTEQKNVSNIGEAISVLIQAVNIAQAKGGVYTFADAAKIHSALVYMDEVAEADQERQRAAATTIVEEKDASVEK